MNFIIKVKLPEGSQVFSTTNYDLAEGRIKFTDKFGNKKDFPSEACFIETKTTGGDY